MVLVRVRVFASVAWRLIAVALRVVSFLLFDYLD